MNPPDSRIPVVFATLAEAGPQDALLLPADTSAPPGIAFARVAAGAAGHKAGCVCCMSRTGAAQAMAALYLSRARGEVRFFTRLVAALDAAGKAAVTAALMEDRFVAARYRGAGKTGRVIAEPAPSQVPSRG